MKTSLGLALAILVAMGACTFDPEELSTPGIRLTDGGDDSVGGTVLDVGGDKAFPTLDLLPPSDAPNAPPDVPMVAEVEPADGLYHDAAVGDATDSTSEVDGSSPTPDAEGQFGVGVACTQASQCERGFCVDGVCCETACTSICTTCNLAGNAGYCSPVPAGTDPKDSCTQDSASTCGRDGTCDGSGGCRLWSSGTECTSASCTAGTATTARTCDGTGTCRGASNMACAPYACKGAACATQCSGNSDCDAGSPISVASYCSGGVCMRRQYSGSCTSAIQCAAGSYCNLGLQTCAGAVCICPASCP